MKKCLVILSTIFLLSSFTESNSLNEVIIGLKAGNASSVSKFFDNTVEITLLGKSNNYSKSQGETILRDFFTNNSVKAFNIIHQGKSGGAEFFIGTLFTNHGTYRTIVNFKKKADKQILQEIKFEN